MTRSWLSKLQLSSLLLPLVSVLPGHDGYAQVPTGSDRPDAIRRHEELAKLHAKMARCLKENTDVLKCRESMKRDCERSGLESCSTLAQLDSMVGERKIRDTTAKPSSGATTSTTE